MYEYVDNNTDRIGLFKKGLYNLDCFQIANRHYDIPIPICGFVKSPIGELTEYGRLGYVQAWELRPVKPERDSKGLFTSTTILQGFNWRGCV
jgi:hypothetical protein